MLEDPNKPVLTWLGTAGFKIETATGVILIDPFLSRNAAARPRQELKPEDLKDADHILISHGHFDHIADVPAVMVHSPADVYCSAVTAQALVKRGVMPARIHTLSGGEKLELGETACSVTAIRHIRFDVPLVLRTLTRVIRTSRSTFSSLERLPAGPVLCYSLVLGGLTFTHMGSLGITPTDAKTLLPRTDVLMPPLQGHTDICSRAAAVAKAVEPQAVVIQHQDDFFPPVSTYVNVEPFRRELKLSLPGCKCYEPRMNVPFTIDSILE